MKKIIGTIVLGMLCEVAFCQTAQTGINTKTPQQALQVSGTPSSTTLQNDGTTGRYVVTPTIRIEGLNQTNNTTAHPAAPAISTQPLYATSNGDLVIGGNRVNKVFETPPVAGTAADGVTPGIIATAVGVYPAVSITGVISTITFTLARASMVYINASVSIGSVGAAVAVPPAATPPLNDSKARMVGIKLQFTAVPAGSGIPVNVPFAAATDSYTAKADGTTTQAIPTGYFFYNIGKELKLPAGAYTFRIFGIATANGSTGGSFAYDIGKSTIDKVNIIAIAL